MAKKKKGAPKKTAPKNSKKKGVAAGASNAAADANQQKGPIKVIAQAYVCSSRTLTFTWETLPGHRLVQAYVHVGSVEYIGFEPTTPHELFETTVVPYTGGATGSSHSPLYPTTGDGEVYAYVWFLYTRAEGGSVGDCGIEGEGEGEQDGASGRNGGLYHCGSQTLIVEWPEMAGYHRDVAFVHVGSQEIPSFDPTMPHTLVTTHEHEFEGDDTIMAFSDLYPTLGDGEVFAYAWLGYTRADGGRVADCGIIE